MSIRLQWTLAILLSILLALAAVSGCDDDDSACRPSVPAGTIKGTIRTGGVPFEASVTAVQVNPDRPSFTTFADDVADDGSYELDLPTGDYVVSLRFRSTGGAYYYTSAGPSWGNLPVDTLRISSTSAFWTADFDLGGVIFRTEVPDVLEDENFRIRLHPHDDLENPTSNAPVTTKVTTVVNGMVEIFMPGVLPGEYQVELEFGCQQSMCDGQFGGELIWLPGTRDREASPWTVIGVDERANLTCDFPTTWASLEGSVTGAWQEMGSSVLPEIALVTTDSTWVFGLQQLDEGADFSIDILWPEPVKMMVSSNGISQWVGGSSFDEAAVFELERGQTTQGADLLQSGLVLDLAMIEFNVGTLVCWFYDPNDFSVICTSKSQYGSDRFIGIPNLAPGDYILEVEPYRWDRGRSIWRPQWFDRATTAAEAQIITIGDGGDIATLNLVLEIGGEIRGSVQQSSEPAKSYHVMVTTPDDEVVKFHSYAWAQSQDFVVYGLPDGFFKIGICEFGAFLDYSGPPPEETVWYPGTTNWDAASLLEIEDAETLEGVVFEMP